MATSRKPTETRKTRRPPATTPEAREKQMVSLAVDLAEKQMLEGTASSQVITHYLKLASTREKLEQQKLVSENQLLQAKIESLETGKRIEELYGKAIVAMNSYRGEPDIELDFDD